MKLINTTEWKKFNILDIFIVKNTRSILKSEIVENSGIYPYVTSSKDNNGVTTFADIEIDKIEKGQCLLIGGKTMIITYQSKDFISNDSHNLALYLRDNNTATENIWFFLKTALEASISYLYHWGDSISNGSIAKDVIYLPQTSNGTPDWDYMNCYIDELKPKMKNRVTCIYDVSKFNSKKLDISSWETFHLYDIFNIDSGNKLDKIKMDTSTGDVNFVGRSNANNGVTQKCKRIEGIEPYPEGCLTLALGGAYLGSCFIQNEPFYTSQNVSVLIPKIDISDLSKQFIATAIFIESQNNYQAFIKELNSHIKKDFSIKLPCKPDKTPDYGKMELYMKNIESAVKSSLSAMNML